ncbi:MAG: ABC transporter ATP-binding protein [Gemmataceae bacterium]|nr:ABC transporter ATP-binding protein [Gemmataceae bacterium]
MVIVETKNLAKNYGRIQALRGVSLRVERGEIYGLLGQNGAGKTTLIKVLLGIARGWEGDATLLGAKVGAISARRQVGYLPEDHHFPDYHTGCSLLNFYGELLGVGRQERRRRIPEVLEMVGLVGRMHSKLRTYSKGMKQRVGIAQAIFHDPAVIFLDEPTDGVDPLGRRAIRGLLERLKAQGKTIFINSHLLSEVELICDRVGILQRGQMIREGGVEELTRQRGQFVVGLAPGQDFPTEDVRRQGYAVRRDGNLWEVELTDSQNIDPVVDLVRARGLSLRYLIEKRQTLEDLFLATVEAAEPGVDRPAPVVLPVGPSDRHYRGGNPGEQSRPRA